MIEPEPLVYEFGDFRLDPSKRLLFGITGETAPLMPKAFDTLFYLVCHAGETVSKEELISAVWPDAIVEENNLSQNISILRRVLGEKPGENRYIATIPGRGFKFVADIRAIGPDNASVRKASGNEPVLMARPAPGSRAYAPVLVFFAGLILLGGVVLTWSKWEGKDPKAGDPSIGSTLAVLPFKPLVAQNRDEVLEMGMADTLITKLGAATDLVVRPLSSVRRFHSLEQDAVQAGRALSADSVLEGSIQRWGDTIRINVRLLQTSDGRAIWTGTFDEKSIDILRVQDTIAEKVTTSLHARINPGTEPAEKYHPRDPEAYENFLRGRYHLFRISQADMSKAVDYFQKAVDREPEFALAHAGLSDAYRTQTITGFARSSDACPQAKTFARHAMELDSSLPEAYVAAGWISFFCDWDWERAEAELKRAIELQPNNSEAYRGYAHVLSTTGRHEEALVAARKARELAPLTLITAALEAQFLMYAGRYEEAIDRLQKTRDLDPGFWVVPTFLGRVYLLQGRYDEAVPELMKGKELAGSGSSEPLAQLAYLYGKMGRREDALAAIAELERTKADRHVPNYFLSLAHLGLGNNEEALEFLERSYSEREAQITFIKVESRWDGLRSTPRFTRLLQGLRLS